MIKICAWRVRFGGAKRSKTCYYIARESDESVVQEVANMHRHCFNGWLPRPAVAVPVSELVERHGTIRIAEIIRSVLSGSCRVRAV